MAPLASLAVLVLAAQSAEPPLPGAPTATSVAAVRAAAPPAIDGRDADAVWGLAHAITAFRQFQPVEDADPSFRTEAKVAYDARNFYVFIRAFDPRPDSILKLLARRDFRTASDQLKIVIDSYHDRRSGFEFAVNPAGVKRDYAVYNDVNEDDAWDGVWEVATQVDSLGWTAEFRIPLSQLRYAPAPTNTFGFAVWRDIDRYTERVGWPLYRVSRPGFASQLGEVTGLEGLASPTRLEVAPYAVTKNVSVATGPVTFERDQQFTVGADIKYGLTSNITVDATANPDFGQVEADPSVLNLGPFETFYQERRPFFIEGTGIFQFSVNCSVVNCGGEGLFYSRRVGERSKILGAAKVTGRLPSGLSLGFVDGVTERTADPGGLTIAPLTNYAALRAQQDFRKGESGVGIMATAVNRDLDSSNVNVLRSGAYVAAVDFRHRFAGERYRLSGSFDLSRVVGSPAALILTQQDPVHRFQRPDDDLIVGSRRTLSGNAQELLFRKTAGFIQFETSYERRSPGFELNDLGFLRRADQQSWNNWGALNWLRPAAFFQRGFWNFNWWQYWTAAGGLPTERAANTNAHFQLNNRWWVHAGGTLGQLGGVFNDREARGGPAVRLDPYLSAWAGVEGDGRRPIVPFLWFNYYRGDGGRSMSVNVNPSVDFRVSTGFRSSVSLNVTHGINDRQFYGMLPGPGGGGGGLEPTFARLDQKEVSLSARLDYTASPTLTIQAYAQPFVSKGPYSNVRELANPRAERYQDRFQAYGDTAVTNNPRVENFKAFNSNLVLRWEYRPGSTLFLVWSQGRADGSDADVTRTFPQDFRRLFTMHPNNTFLVKVSYWLSR
jgi:hypothetical protein